MSKFRKKAIQFGSRNSPELEKELEEVEKTMSLLGANTPQLVLDRHATIKKLMVAPNKVNATKIVYNGVEYDSKREAKFAKELDAAGLQYESQVQVELMEGFRLESESIRPITIIVDFLVCGDWFVDIKGIELQPFPIKWKMLKNKFRDSKKYVTIHKDSEISDFIILAKRTGWKNT